MMDLASAALATGGRVVGPEVAFSAVGSDSRDAVKSGELFVALAGERFDGHGFVAQALARGAACAMVSRIEPAYANASLLLVDDTLAALGRLAAAWRQRMTLPLILVVGSNGKTTVKEMTADALRAHFGSDAVLATRGNLNNAIGLPLTLLKLEPAHRAAVVELGMNHRGETGELAPLAAPGIVVINNAQREHQEFMDGVAEVAAEHADAILALPPDGVAVINVDDPHVNVWRAAAARARVRTIGFGFAPSADVHATLSPAPGRSTLAVATPAGKAELELAAPGLPMARNALAACAAALAAGAALPAILRGLAAFRPVAGRLATRTLAGGAVVIDDSYNANPDSVRAAIDVLARMRGERWLALGDMGEVGAHGPAFHREVGEYARSAGLDRLYTTGTLARDTSAAFGRGAVHFDGVPALATALGQEIHRGVTVLVKGSRFMRMERVVAALAGEPVEEH